MESFDDLPQGQILDVASTYVLKQDQGDLEFRVFKHLNGPQKGQFTARPYMAFTYGDKQFVGHGETEEQAMLNLLDRIKGVPHAAIFPPHDEPDEAAIFPPHDEPDEEFDH